MPSKDPHDGVDEKTLPEQYFEFIVSDAEPEDRESLEQPLPSHLKVVQTVTTYGAYEEPI